MPVNRIWVLAESFEGKPLTISLELLTAARSLDLRRPLTPAPATGAVRAALRESVPGPGPDRHLGPEIDAAVEVVASGRALAAAESVLGPLS